MPEQKYSIGDAVLLDSRQDTDRWVVGLMVSLVLIFSLKAFVFDVVAIEGSSMNPTLVDGDQVMVNKLFTMYGEPEYGDILIVKATKTRNYIKRVIGKGGDTIEVKDSIVYRNGEPLEEDYITDESYPNYSCITVPEGEYFMMGDNRAHSGDSRSVLGTVSKDRIVAKVTFRFFPYLDLSN